MACSQCKAGPAALERGTALIDYVLMALCVSILAIVAITYSGSSTAAEYARAGQSLSAGKFTLADAGAGSPGGPASADDGAGASSQYNGDTPGQSGPAGGGWSGIPANNHAGIGNSGH